MAASRAYEIITLCIIGMVVTGAARGEISMSDSQKKEAVYRMYDAYRSDFAGAAELSVAEAKKMAELPKVVLVDVRKAAERKVSGIAGAITEAAFIDNPTQYRNHTVIAYCTIGYRSGKFVQRIKRQGWQGYNLKGGILAWILEGEQIHDHNGPTQRVHVYGKRWDLAPNAYETVRFGPLKGLLSD